MPRIRSIKAIAGVTLVALVALGPTSPAMAGQYEQYRFNDQATAIRLNFCGDLLVRMDYHDQGVVIGRTTGAGGLCATPAAITVGVSYTNLASGKAMTATWNYLNHDVRIIDNGDGTITNLFQIPGPETWYGPDGATVFTSGGTIRFEAVIDYAGTPGDPLDDTFISEEFVSVAGGKPQDDFNFSATFRLLTG